MYKKNNDKFSSNSDEQFETKESYSDLQTEEGTYRKRRRIREMPSARPDSYDSARFDKQDFSSNPYRRESMPSNYASSRYSERSERDGNKQAQEDLRFKYHEERERNRRLEPKSFESNRERTFHNNSNRYNTYSEEGYNNRRENRFGASQNSTEKGTYQKHPKFESRPRNGNNNYRSNPDNGGKPAPYKRGKEFGGYNNRTNTPDHNKPQFINKSSRQMPDYGELSIPEGQTIRLNKFLANAGISSRREADDLIEAGGVWVNGKPVTELGYKISDEDRVEVNGKEVKLERKVYVLLNKPRNCVTTSEDPQERLTVLHLVKSAAKERIYPVGRLDRNTTGVLLLTNDGDLAAKLVHPSFLKKKIYHVWLDKAVSLEDMQRIADGVILEDGEMHADAISYASDEDQSQVGIEIHSGRNRIVRRIFEHLGYKVIKLDRVYFAGLTKKNLGRGKWRYLTSQEVANLKMGAFE